MNLTSNAILNFYSILLLLVIYVYTNNRKEKDVLQQKIYHSILLITGLLLVFDHLSWYEGRPDTFYPVITHIGTPLVFMFNLGIPSLWLLYIHYQVYQDEAKTRRLFRLLAAVNAVNAVLGLASLRFGWFYSIDSANIYHRGPFFFVPTSLVIGFLVAAFILLVLNREKIGRNNFIPLALFPFPPFVCIILQIIFFGYSLVLNGVVLSLLIVCLYVQNKSLHTDYLTGIHNRKKLDEYLIEKVRTSTADNTFAVIMLDLDNFKYINDTLGHAAGDEALGTFASLLSGCVRSNDFLARFGGDEFFIVLDNVSKREVLEMTVQRIRQAIDRHNETSSAPYQLGVSAGYDIYDPKTHMSMEAFLDHIDRLMYADKRLNQNLIAKDFSTDETDVTLSAG